MGYQTNTLNVRRMCPNIKPRRGSF
uniref:Uncharacterized protein n=1 Tax=Arundo donax TaxID=35708 RepID=A0A0A9CAM3_ARUDO